MLILFKKNKEMQINKIDYYNLMNENLTNKLYQIKKESEKEINEIKIKLIELKKEYNNELIEHNKKICDIIFENFIKNCEKEKYFLIKYKKFKCINIFYDISESNIFINIIFEDENHKKIELYAEFDKTENDLDEKIDIKLKKTECSYEKYILKDYDIKNLLEMIYFYLEKDLFYTLIY